MSYYFVGGCRYSIHHKWISQPLSSSPHGGIFHVLPKFYQDYENEIRKQKEERARHESNQRDESFKFFWGFFGFDSDDKEEQAEQAEVDYPYSVFGLKRSASDDDMKRAYRKSILKSHPDKGGSNEAFRKIQEAWEYFKKMF